MARRGAVTLLLCTPPPPPPLPAPVCASSRLRRACRAEPVCVVWLRLGRCLTVRCTMSFMSAARCHDSHPVGRAAVRALGNPEHSVPLPLRRKLAALCAPWNACHGCHTSATCAREHFASWRDLAARR